VAILPPIPLYFLLIIPAYLVDFAVFVLMAFILQSPFQTLGGLMEKRRTAEIAGFVLLAGVAIAGWARHVNPVAPTEVQPLNTAVSPAALTQQPYQTSGQALLSAQPGVTDSYADPVPPRSASAYRTGYRSASAYSSPAYAAPQSYRRGRSTRKSVAIVAGSAGIGAAVGALAGGGKGAGIGALAGGGAGLLYDRLTHKTHSGL
jgi:hypothetical protein